ncbi:hypothetical protein [Microlunatus sp. GCM10028923]|uniref:hypothetical protein n=1 Tax=Microlunatus sp. GCM10028923 TaxID=3273400 RepID=UPI00360FBFD2
MIALAGSYHCAELTSSDGTIEFSGRLTGTEALIAEMRQADPEAAPDSGADDATLALQAYRIWGIDGFRRLAGTFALAVSDADRLVLARDPLGVEQLYFRHDADGCRVRYGSTIAAVLADGPEPSPSPRVVHRYLSTGALDDEPATFFEGVERVLPGQALIAEPSGVRRQAFLRAGTELLRPTPRHVSDLLRPDPSAAAADPADELRRRLTATVGTPDQPAAVVVAGPGSAALSGLADTALSPEYPDHAQASTAPLPGRVRLTADQFKADWSDFIRVQEEPTGSAAAYLHYRLAQDGADLQTLISAEGAAQLLLGTAPSANRIAGAVLLAGAAVRGGVRAVTGAGGSGRTELSVSLLSDELRSRYSDEGPAPLASEPGRLRVDALTATSLPYRLRSLAKTAEHFGTRFALPYLDLDTVRWLLGQDDETLIKLLDGPGQVDSEPAQADWLMRIKNTVYDVFMSESFANRGYFDQTAVVESFEAFIKRPTGPAAAVFWRILNVELWCREFFDKAQPAPEVKIKTDLEANEGKELDLVLPNGRSVRRYPLRTELFSASDDLTGRVVERVGEFFQTLGGTTDEDHRAATTGRWYFFISEKIVAITQGRSMFVWDIKVSWAARVLSRFVTRTPTGIGLGSPFTMQLAIGEAGLPRILFASAGSVVGKLAGKSGVFYQLVGHDVRAIDGPTEYSAYPSNVSAKLPPKDPDKVAAELTAAIRPLLPEPYASTFAGTVVMDANDLGRNALGQDVPGEPQVYEEMFADNPLGQGSQQTPLAIVFELP